ncbi:MAG: heme ABC exporter ATP-binding protein CcmA [Lachnospiraceae bacterium]|nr:heme ABC exporter ATP-binding protein CcmA [Lachnospiraceae bacterium]
MVEIKQIKKRYGKKSILGDITFQVVPGEALAIVGRNGCGKTTLLQIMAGVLKADGGQLSYFGHEMTKETKAFRKLCGYVPQENPLLEELSVKDNIRLWGGVQSEAAREILAYFELEELLNTKVEKLSGGMKRRLAIACALLERPPLLLLDEPTAALDIYYQESIHRWMAEYKKQGGIIIMSTHDEHEISWADRCLFIQEGRVEELTKEEKSMERIQSRICGRRILGKC